MSDDPEDGLTWSIERSEPLGEHRIFSLSREWARPPGGGEPRDFYVLDMPDWVQIVPLLPDGSFVMVEQFRHGTRRVTLEFPAGIVEPGETPLDCAVRELEEETGYVADSVDVVGRVDPNAALQTNELFLIVARGCRRAGQRDLDEREAIRTRVVAPDAVDRLIARGEFRDAYGIIAWDFYRRHLG
jgi:8-oxo-dGTP pyrophosphatase MutT (NUDIX family)